MSTTSAKGNGAPIAPDTPKDDTTTINAAADAGDRRPAPPASIAAPSEFDPDSLRLSSDFAASVTVKRHINTIPARKPNRHEFVRVNASPRMYLETAALMLKGERDEWFIVERSLWSSLANEVQPIALFATINRQNVVSLWPIKLPKEAGRQDAWSASALDAAERAKHAWVRVVANMSLGAYEVYEAMGDLPEPEWPDLTLAKMLEIAFRERYVRSNDHPALKKLRGEL